MTGMRELAIDCRDEAERSEIHGTLEATELLRQAASAMEALMPLAEIGLMVADAWPEGSFELDGGELQDLLKEHGLIAAVPGGFNSAIHTDWNAECPAEGDEWLMPTELDRKARALLLDGAST